MPFISYYSFLILTLLFSYIYPFYASAVDQPTNKLIDHVKVIPNSFNPSLNQKVELCYQLNQKSSVTVIIFGPDGEPIKTIVENEEKTAGNNKEMWNGKDMNDQIVPNEAYCFIIKAVDHQNYVETYKPIVKKWVRFDTPEYRMSKISNTISYKLPKPARTRIRIGLKDGPLTLTLLDWHPKIAGEILVHWDGWDEGRTMKLWEHPNYKMVITNMELPENCIITYGNKKESYIEYNQLKTNHQNKPKGPTTTPATLSTMLSPKLKISFPMAKKYTQEGIPVLNAKTLVRVEVENKIVVATTHYEIIFFLDENFYAEEPLGTSPYNWVWNLSKVTEGEHILTVNVVSFNDQIGTLSQKVNVVK